MKKSDLEYYRDKLNELAARLRGHLAGLREEALRGTGDDVRGNLSRAPMHPADLGTDSFEQETSMGLLEMQGQTLIEIDNALERIRNGTFGRCLECRKEISRGRLNALPYTAHCIGCAQRQQRAAPLIESPGNL
jgi:RNA polymerase-binding transcription factor DksA